MTERARPPSPPAATSNHLIEARDDPARGRGVSARQPILAGTPIEAAPDQYSQLDRTFLRGYYFH